MQYILHTSLAFQIHHSPNDTLVQSVVIMQRLWQSHWLLEFLVPNHRWAWCLHDISLDPVPCEVWATVNTWESQTQLESSKSAWSSLLQCTNRHLHSSAESRPEAEQDSISVFPAERVGDKFCCNFCCHLDLSLWFFLKEIINDALVWCNYLISYCTNT